MTTQAKGNKNYFSDAHEALADVSRLLSRLARSRKAPSRLQDIINLTGAAARLSRSLQGTGAGHGDADDGYGDKEHINRISAMGKARGVIR